ncbi:MAG: hypothetical protein GXP01_08335 [Alphaproteobacteria bacterium]|nr:hypothetical protein [Alphaproteobacteria bacterium]
MSALTVIYWRDIPTQVALGTGRRAKKRPLAPRFLVAVDKAAMAAKATSDDAYLEDWRRETIAEEPDVEALAEKLEAAYPAKRLAEIANNGGFEKPPET